LTKRGHPEVTQRERSVDFVLSTQLGRGAGEMRKFALARHAP
jgi:hypothetical protein